jgi:hypothetical protein
MTGIAACTAATRETTMGVAPGWEDSEDEASEDEAARDEFLG